MPNARTASRYRELIQNLSVFALCCCALYVQPSVAEVNDSAVATEKPAYNMGVFPYLPPRQLEKVFAPMAKDLGETINKEIVFRTNTTFSKFSRNLDAEEYDIAFVQPFDYIRAADKLGYKPLVTRKGKLLSMLMVRQDSPLNSIADVKGKRIAFPPSSAAVSRLMKVHLRNNGIDPEKDVTITHHRSHVSCMQQVLIGEADACGTAAPAVRFFQHKMKVQLKPIAKSDQIPHPLFAVHPRVSAEERQAMQQRILEWAETPEGRKLLDAGKLLSFERIEDSAYDVVRALAKQTP